MRIAFLRVKFHNCQFDVMYRPTVRLEGEAFCFENAFPNRRLDGSVYTEVPRYLYSEIDRRENVMKLKTTLYALKLCS